ncbi:MAG TPA: oligosaccharide flippase family protein [Gemmata sp.]|jgi:O-antigen/teichoic acid export membrane protein|nr:oligosaccharide flippase family protein [Gemmata sp.]
MNKKTAIKRNMIWNTAGLIVEVVTGFILMPFLIARLGDSTYGVWLVLGALTSWFGLLELGTRGAVGRQIALHHAAGDQRAVDQTLSGGVAVLLFAGLSALMVLLLCEPIFFEFYKIPAADQEQIGVTLRLVAINFAIVLLGTAFDAFLWGLQRFDLLNAVDVPVTLLRLAGTLVLVHASSDLVVLAIVTVVISGMSLCAKSILSFRANLQLRVGILNLTRSSLRQLFGYGSWNMISTLARLSRTQLAPILIGNILGLALVPLYAVAARLMMAVNTTMDAVTGVLTPHATELHATQQADRQRDLFIVFGRYAATLATLFITYLLVLGDPLILLWVGPSFSAAGTLLTLLVLGDALPCMQYVTRGIILATARHNALALFAVLEVVAVCGLMIVLLPLFGLIGVGLAVAIPAFLARGVAPMIHGCRIVGVPLFQYLLQTIAPPLLCAVLPALVVRLAVAIVQVEIWPVFIGYSVAYTLLFVICYTCFLDLTWLSKLYRLIWVSKQLAPPIVNQSVLGGEERGAVAGEPLLPHDFPAN